MKATRRNCATLQRIINTWLGAEVKQSQVVYILLTKCALFLKAIGGKYVASILA
jgi:hypothetical protein